MFKDLKKYLIENEGATLNKRGEIVNLKSGYQVSICDGEQVALEDFDAEIIEKYLDLLNRGEYLGLWLYCGQVYIDISKRIDTKAKALKVGKFFEQISVWNWNKRACVMVA